MPYLSQLNTKKGRFNMGKKHKKIFREQYEEPVDVNVFDDDAALDALIKDYLNEERTVDKPVIGFTEKVSREEAKNTMCRILSNAAKSAEEKKKERQERQPVEPKSYEPTNKRSSSLSLQPTLGISEFLDRVVLTDKTGVTTYASTKKYHRHTNPSDDDVKYDSDQLGMILSEFEYLLLVDSTPSAVYYYKEFFDRFKDVTKTNLKRFLFFIDDDFNYRDEDRVYCFFNGNSFYDSCSDTIGELIDLGFNDGHIVDIMRDLVIYHGQTSFIGRDSEYEFDAFHDSKYNSKDKITDLIRSDRLTTFRENTVDGFDPDLAAIFEFAKFSDIEYREFSPLPDLDDREDGTQLNLDVVSVGEAAKPIAEAYAEENNLPLTEINTNEDTQNIEEEEVGATNDIDPFQTSTENDTNDSDGVRLSGGDGNRDVNVEQEVQEEAEEEIGEGGVAGVVDADPETFQFEEEKEEENGSSEPPVKPSSSGGSMVLPVMTI